ncbi:N-terminal nucleophile aminohydrolase [Linderina pennispora]|uniref:N-terminal nucleophile aminohydrolase n=1 Tax=Linderina pennispora TaxID=61395 RepID=A0A1Y1W699_9FUNG|nr:N-terminal nucleophile aminohydrolase [Linderina pennispora]ORX69077.1 N-terminal nucleophile aminohydrolase [Linderina pennispora]
MPSRCCIVVHVGAGTHGESKVKRYKQAMRNACQLAIEKLRAGHPAHEVVESAIRVLEDDPVTNAGIGSNLNRLGQVECDAAIMATHPDAFGAVGAIEAIRNPIEAAHAVMLKSSQVGHGADEWARSNSVVTDDNVRHKITEEAMHKYETYMKQVTADKADAVNDEAMQDTVGAVCIDMEGDACAGVSSGGIALKLPGRVGEAAMFGCGCWAERSTKSDAVACSVTGTGEQIMRVMLARECAQKRGDMFTVLNQCFAAQIGVGTAAGILTRGILLPGPVENTSAVG